MRGFKNIILDNYSWFGTDWKWMLSEEMRDGTTLVYDHISDWLMIAEYFTHE